MITGWRGDELGKVFCLLIGDGVRAIGEVVLAVLDGALSLCLKERDTQRVMEKFNDPGLWIDFGEFMGLGAGMGEGQAYQQDEPED